MRSPAALRDACGSRCLPAQYVQRPFHPRSGGACSSVAVPNKRWALLGHGLWFSRVCMWGTRGLSTVNLPPLSKRDSRGACWHLPAWWDRASAAAGAVAFC